jgi:hypothetical protein
VMTVLKYREGACLGSPLCIPTLTRGRRMGRTTRWTQ